jgi:hypothetical protein
MKRVNSIQSKLSHIASQQQELHGLLFQAEADQENLSLKISHRVGDILTNSTECFQYAAHDIAERHLENLKEPYYFPFYLAQLGKYPWDKLRVKSSNAFQVLQSFINKIESDAKIPKTLFDYRAARRIHELVRAKKHLNIIKVEASEKSEVHIELNGMQVILPPQQLTRAAGRIRVAKGAKVTQRPEYLIESLTIPVRDICLEAEQTTRIILTELYRAIFNTPIELRSILPEGETSKNQ